ncbi:MAG: response regulator containing CheY-like receiver domain and AraC-type DNA-binding [Prolixibacteraceae bacterium]|nr:MAG: response regulator containing CheY-like receiver domain and AraC-type DNA-binding [Prolixibacteraceae bacterium]
MAEDLIIYTPMYVTFFWAVVLLITKREDNRAKFFLGIFMTVAFLLYFSHAVFFQQLESVYTFFDTIYVFAFLSVYPLYYWYIKLLSVETEYKLRNFRLFIPALVLTLISFVLYQLMSDTERADYYMGHFIKSKSDVEFTILMQLQKNNYLVSKLIFAIQIFFFLYYGSRLVKNYHKKIENFYSNLESRSILWVNILLYSMVLTSLMSLVLNIIGRSFFMGSKTFLIFPSLIFSILLFLIGFLGYLQNNTVIDLEFDEEKNNNNLNSKNYNTAKLNEKLLKLFKDVAIYKNPDLKITQVSELLHTNRTYISKHINTQFGCTFSDFVNRYRVEEAKRLLTSESSKGYSLNYISEKAGFGSMGSFMRVFRGFEKITPGQYREKHYR